MVGRTENFESPFHSWLSFDTPLVPLYFFSFTLGSLPYSSSGFCIPLSTHEIVRQKKNIYLSPVSNRKFFFLFCFKILFPHVHE